MNFTEEIYKKKYLKYKAKYLELRGGSFFNKVLNFVAPKKITKEERDFICNTPDYVDDECNESLKDYEFKEKINKEERQATLKEMKKAMATAEKVKIKYTNGIIYIGKLTNGVTHNYATLKYPNGDTYTGNITGLIPNGYGVMRDASDKISYDGTFIDGKPKGKESLVLSKKHNYYGEVLNGKPHGYGELKYSNGTKYIGNFENGKRHGLGYMEMLGNEPRNNGSYNGNWVNDRRHGYGVFTWSMTGNKWEGTWANDEMLKKVKK